MKLTIDIPTERTAEVLRFLAALMPASEEPQADPAPGHPEFPLPDMPVNTVPQKIVDRVFSSIAAADPFKVAMDDPVHADECPTRRELLWGDLPEPPPLPEGKTRWVNRGKFQNLDIKAIGREVAFLDAEGTWRETFNFSTLLPHIEAI
jgi:hypothetical protein